MINDWKSDSNIERIEVDIMNDLEYESIAACLVGSLSRLPPKTLVIENLDSSGPEFSNRVCCFKITCPDKSRFLVKVVPAVDLESETLSEVISRHPGLVSANYVSIPMIFEVVFRQTGERVAFMHVTKWLDGYRDMAHLLTRLWSQGKHSSVFELIERFGKFVKSFHNSFPGIQHNDMNPMNVLITDELESFVLVDCAGLDDEVGDDVRNFILCLEEMSLGSHFFEFSRSAFLRGYNST